MRYKTDWFIGYDFEIKKEPGFRNKVADALLYILLNQKLSSFLISSGWNVKIFKVSIDEDEELKQIKQLLSNRG